MSGGYQQAKLLLDLCELDSFESPQSSELNQQQLCDALLEGLRLQSPKPESPMAEDVICRDRNPGEK